MKLLRHGLVGLASLLLLVALLLWFLPARWAMPWLQPRLRGLQLQHVGGTLWDGHAGQLLGVDKRPLGQLQWRLSRRALLGRRELWLRLDGPRLAFSGDLRQRDDGRIEAHALSVRAEASALQPYLKSSLGQPRGELVLSVDHLLLQGGWPMELQGRARWEHAQVHTREGDVELGTVLLLAQADDGVVQASWHDEGHGPLQVQGRLQISPLGWRLDAALRARHTDPPLQRWLARLGPASADGGVHIQYHGGLAGSVPAPSPEKDTTPP